MFLPPFFMSWTQRSKTFSMYTKGLFLSNIVYLCIQNAINKMDLCSLSMTYACPYHNPTATMGHLIHNVDISKPLTHTMPYTLSAICPVQWKPGFIREENTSLKCQMPSNVSICPLKSVTMTNCSQVETPMRMTSMQMSFPEKVSGSLCRNSLVIQTDCCSSCPDDYILEWPFIVASIRIICAIIMLSNQHLDMPHLWGEWIISAKEKCSLTQI